MGSLEIRRGVDARIEAYLNEMLPGVVQAVAQMRGFDMRGVGFVGYPVVGECGFVAVKNDKAATLEFKHTAGMADNFLMVFIGVTIPDTVPGGSLWPDHVYVDDVEVPMVDRVLTSGATVAGVDATRGFIEMYAAPIKPDYLGRERTIRVEIATGKADNYTLRAGSVSMPNAGGVLSAAFKQGTTSPTAATAVTFTSAESERIVGAAFNASTPGEMTVEGADVEILYEHRNGGGQPFTIFTVNGAATRTITASYPGTGPYKRGIIAARISNKGAAT